MFWGVGDNDRGFGRIFLQMMARSAEQILAPVGHLSTLHLQFFYECAHLPYPEPQPLPPPPHACSKWRDELLMSDGLAVRGVLCPCFQLADVKRLCVYIYYNLVYELWHGESCLFFGLQRFKRILLVSSPPPRPATVSLSAVLSLLPLCSSWLPLSHKI